MHFALPRRRGYTLVELFLTLAVLMVILGMMINVSNRLRHESADRLTRGMMARLTTLMNQYQARYGDLPPIHAMVDPGVPPTEASLQAAALVNSADLVRYLNLPELAEKTKNADDPLLSSVRQRASAAPILEDPWGSPIIFMPSQDSHTSGNERLIPAIGFAPGNVFFFCSAGKDRAFLTHDDNVYSYEENAGSVVSGPLSVDESH